MAKEWTPDDVFDVLADDRVRSILVATNVRTRSVHDLTRVCEGSQSAIYRRVSILLEHGFLKEQTKVDADGHHYSVYEPDFENVDIRLDTDTIVTTIHVLDGSAVEHVERWEAENEEE